MLQQENAVDCTSTQSMVYTTSELPSPARDVITARCLHQLAPSKNTTKRPVQAPKRRLAFRIVRRFAEYMENFKFKPAFRFAI